MSQPPIDHDPDDEPNYENRVGYGKPPKHSRWPSGYCPNPAGRPRKANSRKHHLLVAASRPVSIRIGKRLRRVTTLEAIIELVKARAIAGHVQASRIYDTLTGFAAYDEEEHVPEAVYFSHEKLTDEEWFEKYAPRDVTSD